MWVKKTKEELQNEEKEVLKFKDSFKAPFFVFILSVFVLVLGDIFGQNAISTWEPKSFSEILESYPKYFFIGISLSIITYIYQWRKKIDFSKEKSNVLMCEKCCRSKNYDENLNCNCGGRYISIDKMKWVDEDDT